MSENHTERPNPDRRDSPLDRALDVALYGPVGLAMAAREMLPDWIAEGRRQVEGQLTLARTIGRLAVHQGPRQAGDVVRRVADQAESVLTGLGLIPDARTGSTTRTAPGTDSATDTPTDTAAGARAGSAPAAPPAPRTPPSPGPGPVGASAAQLAIPGYDTLSASQVVQRLPGLSADELEAVRLHEVAGRSRKTVLLKVAQLRQGP